MKKILLIFILFITSFMFGQDFSIEELNDLFDKKEYAVISENYKEVPDNHTMEKLKKIGDANFAIAKYEESSKFYHSMFYHYVGISPDYYFKYAQVLKANGDYELSDKIMQKYLTMTGLSYRKTSEYKQSIDLRNDVYSVHELSFNTEYADIISAIVDDELIVASSVDLKSKVHKMNNQSFLDLYSVPIDAKESLKESGKKLRGRVNSDYHDSNAVFTKDGNTMYFTRNFSGNKKENKLGIYKAELVRGKWRVRGKLPFTDNSYSTGHPALDINEKYLYFTSDMPGGYGECDLYKVRILDNGDFGSPLNLGSEINTEGKEMFPFISKENILFFSSNYHQGIGGLDIFALDLGKSGDNKIINLASPLNSEKDDFGYVDYDNGKKGFFTSNRSGGVGDDDVYSFKLCAVVLEGLVSDKKTGEYLSDVKIVFLDTLTKDSKEILSTKDGSFDNALACSVTLKISASKEGYIPKDSIVSVDEDMYDLQIALEKVEFVENSQNEKMILIEPIYFDFGKSVIRDDAKDNLNEIVRILNKYPNIKVKATSHTDSRASASYNKLLSQRRAKSSVNYIISQGISSDRISAEGFGESSLVNGCKYGVICSELQHQENRRTEFIIVE